MKTGIYVHIPYCVRKCRYCDFASAPIGGREGSVEPYFRKLWEDIERTGRYYGKRLKADTVFFGGGTPSLVDASYICKTLGVIRNSFTVNQDAEISIEANPGTLSEEKLASYRDAGINRLSLGVQSFDDKVLSAMGRIHDSDEALRSYELSGKYFGNINLDLMMGVPAQDLKVWLETLDRAVSLSPEHLSFYSLQLEEGTPFYNDYKNGLLKLPSREEDRLMYHEGLKLMEAAGSIRYEVSNAARP
ncbi:MAG: radical SAM family heme chaperone HemW, partial [Firmicutes bacterium]|nr:radical SAM family heme chaperone HemW [Bacillota bacterium]